MFGVCVGIQITWARAEVRLSSNQHRSVLNFAEITTNGATMAEQDRVSLEELMVSTLAMTDASERANYLAVLKWLH
jgi:hypothetical protein